MRGLLLSIIGMLMVVSAVAQYAPSGQPGADGLQGPQGPPGPVTNQVVTYNGVVYTITNNPAAVGDVLYFDPASQTAWFAEAPVTDVSGWSEHPATQDVHWVIEVITNVTTNLWVDGGDDVSPDVRGMYEYINSALWESEYYTIVDVAHPYASMWQLRVPGEPLLVWDGPADAEPGLPPGGRYVGGGEATGILTVSYHYVTSYVTNRITAGGADGVSYRVSTNVIVDGTLTADGIALGGETWTNWPAASAGVTLDDVRKAEPLMTNSTDIAIGVGANGTTYGAAVGYYASGNNQGAAVGRLANGNTYGAAAGYYANGNFYGAAVGYYANGNNQGAAVGYYANGNNQGAAVGCYASGNNQGAALGAYASALQTNVALGYQVTNLAPYSTAVRGPLYLDGGTQIYTRPTFGSGAYTPLDTGGSTAKTYPVFRLPMGGTWTDFELKGSTNNFESLVYFYISSGTNTYGKGDTNCHVYFSDDYAADVRKWIKADYGTSIYSQLIDSHSQVDTVYVYPSHDCDVPWQDWMREDNTNLVWSWVRFDGLAFEKNHAGTKQRWNLIQPQWVVERVRP